MDELYEYEGSQYTYAELTELYGDETPQAIEQLGIKRIEPDADVAVADQPMEESVLESRMRSFEPQENPTVSEDGQETATKTVSDIGYQYNGSTYTMEELTQLYGDEAPQAIEQLGMTPTEVKKKETEPLLSGSAEDVLASMSGDTSSDSLDTIVGEPDVDGESRPEITTGIQQKYQDLIDQRNRRAMGQRQQVFSKIREDIAENLGDLTLEDIVAGDIKGADPKDVELLENLNRQIGRDGFEINLERGFKQDARDLAFDLKVQNEIQKPWELSRRALDMATNSGVSFDYAQRTIKDRRLAESVEMLPDQKSKDLHRVNNEIASLNETLNANPEDYKARRKLNDAKNRRAFILRQEDQTLMFDDEGKPVDEDYAPLVTGTTPEKFLKTYQDQVRTYENASDNKEAFTQMWEDKYEKFKAIQFRYEMAKTEKLRVIPIMTVRALTNDEQKQAQDSYEFWREKYAEAKLDYQAINQVMLTNVDPSTLKRRWYQNVRAGGQAMEMTGIPYLVRDLDVSELAERYAKVATDEGFKTTEAQQLNAELTLGEEAWRTIGGSLPAMAEIIGTTIALRKVPIGSTMKRLEALSRMRYGRAGQKAFNFVRNAGAEGLAFELAPSTETTFAMGVGENVGQQLFNSMQKKMGVMRIPLLRYLARIGVGSISEASAEYTGDIVNELTQNGFDVEQAINDVVGETPDQRLRNLALMLITTTGFSASSNTVNAVFSKAQQEVNALPDSEGKRRLQALIEEANGLNNEQMVDEEGEPVDLVDAVRQERELIEGDMTDTELVEVEEIEDAFDAEDNAQDLEVVDTDLQAESTLR